MEIPSRPIWLKPGQEQTVQIIDQRFLPHRLVINNLLTADDAVSAIKEMQVRGAGLIGVTAAYGMYLAALEASSGKNFHSHLQQSAQKLISSRPTAVNLKVAVNRQLKTISKGNSVKEKIALALETAKAITEEDAMFSKKIGYHGYKIIKKISRKKKGGVVNILTHCNAGWLAFVEYGTATAPIYEAFKRKMKIHVWVDETRPRNQGANLTAWELLQQRIPHTLIADNTGGHLMQHGMVDMVITGADRVTRTGDAANKIGTYLKALAAKDNGVPFYIAVPSTSIDWSISDGIGEIPIEQRDAQEVKYVHGWCERKIKKVLIAPKNTPAANYGFDVTPARLITGFITERGVCDAGEKGLRKLFQEADY